MTGVTAVFSCARYAQLLYWLMAVLLAAVLFTQVC